MKQSFALPLCVQHSKAGEFESNVDRAVSFTCEAVSQGAECIVFPEMNLTGYSTGDQVEEIARPVDKYIIDIFSRLAFKAGITILTGLAERCGKSDSIFATHLVFSPEKQVRSYRKIHLAPNEIGCYCPGNEVKIFSHSTNPFGIQLCYDAHFPELSTAMAIAGAKIIYIPHASPRGSSMDKYHSWVRHLCARAFDNSIFIVALNQTGNNGQGLEFPGLAMVVGPDGRISHKFTENTEGLRMVNLDMELFDQVRSHRMKCFLPNRRNDLFPFVTAVVD